MRIFAYILLAILATLFISAIVYLLFAVFREHLRKTKYPEYFHKYNVALQRSSGLSKYFEDNIKPFSIITERVTQAHKDGVLTDDEFSCITEIITNTFSCYEDRYRKMSQEVKQLWLEVHQYAVDNHLKWGELY